MVAVTSIVPGSRRRSRGGSPASLPFEIQRLPWATGAAPNRTDQPPVIGTLPVTLSSSLGSADQSGSVAPAEGDGDAWAETDAEADADGAADAAGPPEQPEIRKTRMIARLGRTRR